MTASLDICTHAQYIPVCCWLLGSRAQDIDLYPPRLYVLRLEKLFSKSTCKKSLCERSPANLFALACQRVLVKSSIFGYLSHQQGPTDVVLDLSLSPTSVVAPAWTTQKTMGHDRSRIDQPLRSGLEGSSTGHLTLTTMASSSHQLSRRKRTESRRNAFDSSLRTLTARPTTTSSTSWEG